MTDTSTTTLPPVADQPSSLEQNLATVLKAAPALAESPGTAVGVAASGGDTVGRAQAIGRAANAANLSDGATQATKPAGGRGVLGEVFGFLGHSVTTAAHDAATIPADVGGAVMSGLNHVGNMLNKPLSVVQHEYRYVHDIEARYGPLSAIEAGLAIAGGAAVGSAVEPGEGTVLGGEAAGALVGHVLHPDAWARTADGSTYRDPHTGAPVSIGRDIASAVTGRRNGIPYDTISAVADGLFDLTADPLAQAGHAIGAARDLGAIKTDQAGVLGIGSKGLTGPLANRWSGLGVRAGDLSGEDVERAYNQYGSVRRAFNQIAGMTSGEVVSRYPQLSPIADRLGGASTPEQVGQVFKEVFRAGELITTDRLPTMSFTRLPFNSLRQAMGNAPQLGDLAYQATGSSVAAKAGDLAEKVVGPSTWARRLERLPNVYNPSEFKFSGRDFSPGDNYGARGIYDLLRLGETPQVAADVVTEYLSTQNLGRRIQIYRNAILNSLAARAHIAPEDFGEFADAETRSRIKESLDSLTNGALPGVTGQYGNALTGRDLSKVVNEDGTIQHAAAILPNQTGNLRIPSAREFRDAAKMLQGGKDLYGRLDDFAYDHITQNFFKRIVLLTGSYAQHISLAEIIPNGLRVGYTNLIRSGIQMNRALASLTNDEVESHVGAIRSLVYKLLRMDRGEVPSNEDVRLAARYVHTLRGWSVPTAASSGEALSGEVKQVERTENLFRKAIFNTPKRFRTTKDFAETGRSEDNFADDWQAVLHEMSLHPDNEVIRLGAQEMLNAAHDGVSLDEATNRASGVMKDWLDRQDPNWLSQYERTIAHSSIDVPDGMSYLDDWSRVMAEHLKGATFNPDGTPHINLLSHIANGEPVPTEELDRIPIEHRPLQVKGRVMLPSGENAIARAANWGFGKVLNPFVNVMSREPLAWNEFKQQWKLVEPAVEDGTMTEDEAMVTAMHRTAVRSVRFVHNLHDRTQWTDTLRNWAPFYFAQEQAYRRMGRMLAEDPGAFRRYQMMITGLQNFATRQNNANGQQYVVLPGTGFLTQGVIGALHALHMPVEAAVPVGMGWNVTSANVIFPMSETLRPGVGPVIAIPAQAISRLFTMIGGTSTFTADTAAIASEISGSIQAGEPIWEQLVPNTILQRLAIATIGTFQAHNGRSSGSSSFDSAFISTMQALDHEGLVPPETAGPTEMQHFLNKVKNQTAILFVMKALVGALTPVSPELQAQDHNFPAELTQDINKAGSVIAGTQAFLRKNPDATPWTVFRSLSPTSAPLIASQQAEDWVNAHSSLINNYNYGAVYFMPQLTDTKYNSTVYNEQIAQDLRQKYTPAEYLNQLYYVAGENAYQQSYQNYLAASKNLSGQALNNLYNSFQSWVTTFTAQHPVWAEIHGAADSRNNRIQAINQMKEIVAKNLAPGPMSDGIKTLLQSYDNYVAAVNLGVQDNNTHAQNVQLENNWQAYLQQTAKENPELSTVINSVFQYAPK